MTQFSRSKIQFFWATYGQTLQLNEFYSLGAGIDTVAQYIQNANARSSSSSTDWMDAVIQMLSASPAFERDLKKSIEKTFEIVNRNRRFGRFTKGELYASMFAVGFPMGFIAKILLNGNLGPIRNAVILHKDAIYSSAIILQGQFISNFLNFPAVSNATFVKPKAYALYTLVTHLSYKYGGFALAEKFAFEQDWSAFIDNYSINVPDARAYRLVNLFYGNNAGQTAFAKVFYAYTNAVQQSGRLSRRGVRRTGLTTSRNAAAVAAGQQLPSTQSVSQTGSTVSQSAVTPAAQLTNTPTTPQTRVRDIPFTGTLGLEVELVPAKDMRESELTNALISEFRKRNLSVQGVGYTHNVTSYWKLVSDASISPYGIECVSPVLKGKRGLTEVKKAIQAMRAAGGSVNQSVGVHVHFGVQGMTLQQWKNLLLNYAGFEPLINKTLFKTRRNSRWASLISNIPNYKEKIDRSNSFEELARNLFRGDARDYRNHGRYHSVNIFAFLRHGTVEFRQLQGSTEDDTIIYWIYWLHFLLEVSKRKTLSFFDYKQVRNITPVWLSTWLGNRSFDMSEENFNAPI